MDDQKLIAEIKELMIDAQHTVAVSESVTSGLLQAALASAENASNFFKEGLQRST